ncbi:MAG: IS66 family insertion sequence element accessory protein TnpB [Eubacteriales bacterium]|nr:IS66 family insertion sequence element accessory protein TnpB [Eubacteriales bacterium]
MNTQKATKEYRLTQWVQVMQERRNCGQSVKEFCQRSGISRNAYFYWQKKLREAACTELAKTEEPRSIVPDGWMQLTSGQVQQALESLEIEVSGCRITVTAGTDHELLKKVCLTLRTL